MRSGQSENEVAVTDFGENAWYTLLDIYKAKAAVVILCRVTTITYPWTVETKVL